MNKFLTAVSLILVSDQTQFSAETETELSTPVPASVKTETEPFQPTSQKEAGLWSAAFFKIYIC